MGYEPDGKEAARKLESAWDALKKEIDQLKKDVNDLKSKSHTHT